jgi:ribose transport system substrate-binding protein
MHRRPTRLAYLGPLADTPFRRDVSENIQCAASELRIEVLMSDSTDDAEENLKDAPLIIESKVDLAMKFQSIDAIAQILAARLSKAGIPLIAIETPIPEAVFFGGNSYGVGRTAGQALGKFVLHNWRGDFDHLLLIESSSRGPASQTRVEGALDSVRDQLGAFPQSRIIHLDGHASKKAQQNRGRQSATVHSFQGAPAELGLK